jgi:hypothetical protein
MPPVGTDHVVPVHAVARMLGWSAARVRSVDEILRPARASDGSRLFDVDRVLFFVNTMDVLESLPPLRVIRISKKSARREGDFERYGRWFRITREPWPRGAPSTVNVSKDPTGSQARPNEQRNDKRRRSICAGSGSRRSNVPRTDFGPTKPRTTPTTE